jgi:glyoxylase-like metal-dependent hydrolase (beta-lactamase superfamily II)
VSHFLSLKSSKLIEMKLHTIDTGLFKLDGGAMFGVVPKSIWNKLNPADDNNMCSWAMRCLLIETGNKLVLIDTGMGNKQDAKFFSYYYPHGDDSLEKSITKLGFGLDDITDVILTHLHFDHCGGAVKRDADGKLLPAFKNAVYWSHEAHWNWATYPNDREKASFLKENFEPIKATGQLQYVLPDTEIISGMKFFISNGHTEAMLIPLIRYKNTTVAYMADLIPSVAHVPIPYVMGYDVKPLGTMKEKKSFLQEALQNNYTLFFEHDLNTECVTVHQTEKGIRAGNVFRLNEL